MKRKSWAVLAMAIGLMFTVLTQASSVTIAATLTALNAGIVDLPQALCLAVGADIGTTSSAALATIGGNVEARRTGLSHVIYNVMTGMMALLLVSPYLALTARFLPGAVANDPEFVKRLVAGHAVNRARDVDHRLVSGRRFLLGDPGALLADVPHLEQEGIDPAALGGLAEGLLVHQRRAGGDHDGVEPVGLDVALDHLLAWVRAHELVVLGQRDVGQRLGELGHRLHVDRAGDVQAAVADVDTDSFRHRVPPGGRQTEGRPLQAVAGKIHYFHKKQAIAR